MLVEQGEERVVADWRCNSEVTLGAFIEKVYSTYANEQSGKVAILVLTKLV